jgi:hypothetical protein
MLAPAENYLAFVKDELGSVLPTFVSPSPDSIPLSILDAAFPTAAVQKVSPALAQFIGALGFERAASGELVDALTLEANYVRRSDAELSRKGA